MGLLDLLPTSNLGLDGITPGQVPSANPNSSLHYQYSINGAPTQTVCAQQGISISFAGRKKKHRTVL